MLQILDVALGLVLIFTLVSFTVSLLTEWISALWGQRSLHLRQALLRMLGEETGDKLCRHPLVESLIPNKWLTNRHGPSWIPTDIFVVTLLAVLDPDNKGATTKRDLLTQLEALPTDNALRQALIPLIEQAGDDWKRVKKEVGEWFNRVMDEVSAWYRRWSQVVLFISGTLLAAVVGVDAIDITRSLWVDDEMRAGVTAVAEQFAESDLVSDTDAKTLAQRTEELRNAQRELAAVGLPLRPVFACASTPQLLWCLFGYLLTGLAASLGAGFWFDLLKKLVRIRTVVSAPPAAATATADGGGKGG